MAALDSLLDVKLGRKEIGQLTVNVTVPKIVAFRVWLGLKLIALGVRVTGMSLALKQEDEQ